jgi:hypothetical protein
MKKKEKKFVLKYVLSPSQNISKKLSTKFNVFGVKFSLNTLIFVDPFLFIF